MIFKIKTFFKLIIIILLIFTYGCEFDNVPENKILSESLLFNLVVGKENQEFYIYRIVNDDEKVYYRYSTDKYFLKDASIILYNDKMNFNSFFVKNLTDSNVNYYNKRNLYYSNSEKLELYPNTNYKIDISINNKHIIGSTTTPSDFNIIFPTPNSTFKLKDIESGKGLTIKWGKSNSAKGYIGKVFIHKGNSIIGKDSQFITQDTIFNYTQIHSTGKAEINIFAYDKNYHNHFIEFSQSAGIEGAYGYFGSSIKKSVTVNIK